MGKGGALLRTHQYAKNKNHMRFPNKLDRHGVFFPLSAAFSTELSLVSKGMLAVLLSRDDGPITVKELVKLTGISKTQVNACISELIQDGWMNLDDEGNFLVHENRQK